MNDYLETGIAVVLIFFVFSIVTYVIQELIAVNWKFRGKMLKSSIEQILEGTAIDEKLATIFFEHPQIKLLQEKLARFPSYVPAANFAMAIMDIVSRKKDTQTNGLLNDFKSGLTKFTDSNGDLPKLLKTWADNSINAKELKENIEKWYNEYMDRVGGWYKNKYRWVTRIIAICVAIGFNLDMIKITETIHGDPVLKATLVAQAEKITDHPEVIKEYYTRKLDNRIKNVNDKYAKLLSDSTKKPNVDSLTKRKTTEEDSLMRVYTKDRYAEAMSLVDSVSGDKLVFGWENSPFEIKDAKNHALRPIKFPEFLIMLIGLFIGAAGISMGAPFWFELMVKLVNVRRAGIKPKEESANK